MGIGAAFATGLVKGFSDNIDKEQARRDKERDRLAGYEATIAQAMMEEEPNYAGINAVKKMVTKARTQMDSLEPIGPFGKRGRDVVMDLTSLQSSLANVGDNRFINIGSYKLMMSDEIASRHNKDRSDQFKKARLEMDALNEAIDTPEKKEAFLRQFKGNQNQLNALRRFYIPHVKTILAERSGKNQGSVDPTVDIREYEFMSDLLNLGIDGKRQAAITGSKIGFLNGYNSNIPQSGDGDVTDVGEVAQLTEAGVTAIADFSKVGSSDSYSIIPISTLTEQGVNMAMVDSIAASQGRNRDIFLHNFSKQFNNQREFTTALRHASEIASLAQDGENFSFLSKKNVLRIGEYFERKDLMMDPDLQIKIIQGIQGPILGPTEQHLISINAKTEDDYKVKDNLKEAFSATYGSTYDEFQTRLRSARKAREQLARYKDIISNVRTVKGTVQDSLLKFLDGFFGETGTVDQLYSLVGTAKNEQEERAIKSRIEILKNSTGERAQRDTLAFIIAANMARAEDQGGRLSDGDIQRNLDKLSPGFVTKAGEELSVEEVILTIDNQIDTLAEIDGMVSERGQRGFGIDLQRKIRAVNTRDKILAAYNVSQFRGETGPLPMSFDEASALETSTLYPAKNANHSVKTDGKGTFVVIDTVENKVIGQGLVKDLTKNGLIGRANPVNKPTSPASADIETEAPKAKNLVDDAAKQSLEAKKVIRGVDLESVPSMEGAFYIIDGKKYRKDIVNGEDTYTLVEEQGS